MRRNEGPRGFPSSKECTRLGTRNTVKHFHRLSRHYHCRGIAFGPTASGSAREAIFRPAVQPKRVVGGRRCVTPRQACPRPNGLGRNLRSKTRWFTGFCNSHQVSHFATFFIDARAEISVAESRYRLSQERRHKAPRQRTANGAARRTSRSFSFRFLGATRAVGSLVSNTGYEAIRRTRRRERTATYTQEARGE